RYRQHAPLVFMNACRSGGLAVNYTHLTGWACAFVRAGVGAFIGSLWEARDAPARVFAECFCGRLLDKKDLRETRKGSRRAHEQLGGGDRTWLASTLYGNRNGVAMLDGPTA